jgi:hypothetical protein
VRWELHALRLSLALGVAGFAACGGGALGPGRGAGGGGAGGGRAFPTPKELEELADAPVPESLFGLDVGRVEEWRLAGPFPARVETAAFGDGTPWSEILDEAARRRVGLAVPTEAMYCVARELGRFFLATGGRPSDSLLRFMTTRCRATVAQVSFAYVEGAAPPGRGEVEILTAWRGSLERIVDEGLAAGPSAIGIWFGRHPPREGGEGERAVVMVASGRREVHVEPLAPAADESGRLLIRGEALEPRARVRALANHGDYGVEPCESLPGVAPPRFAFACALDPDDSAALVAVAVASPDSVLSRVGLYVLASARGEPPDTYRVLSHGSPRIAGDVSTFGEDLTELLNEVRARAGLRPVVVDAEQSRVASELAPPFFAALVERGPRAWAELAMLGMLAGWSVDGTVQAGYCTSAWTVQETDLGRLLSDALEEPGGRETLLAPEVERIAIGGIREGEGEKASLAALFGTYELFSEADHARSRSAVLAALAKQRARRGRAAPVELDELDPLCNDASIRVASGAAPDDAMDRLLRASVDRLGRSATGWIAELGDLDEIEFPEEYLEQRELSVAVAVSHRQREGEAWSRYVVLLVIAEPEGRRV